MRPKLWLSPTAQRIAEDFDGDAEQGIRHLVRQALMRSKIKGPPYFPDLVAGSCGVTDIRSVDIRQHGLLVKNGDGLKIYVNRRYPIRSDQWNAICAHELGHALLLQYREDNPSRISLWTTEEEHLCDLAGRELLLPMRMFRSLITPDGGFSIESLTSLVGVFCTPPRMTALRLVETGLWKSLVMQWMPLAHAPEHLGLAWWHSRLEIPAPSLRRGVAPSALFGETNRIDRAWREKTPTLGLEQLTPGSAWWFMQSGPYEDSVGPCVISLVRLQ